MYTINRSIAIIKPKQPFVDWANELPDAELKSSLDEFKTDCLAISRISNKPSKYYQPKYQNIQRK